MTNGRDKGKRGERECARLLEAWWRRLEPGCEFVTTPSSGGWASAGLRGEFRASGDLMTTAAHFPFSVEVKWREAWALKRLTLGQSSPVWGWWLQAQRAAEEMRAEPLLLFRRNRFPWLAMLRLKYAAPQGRFREPVVVLVAEWDDIELDGVEYGELPVLVEFKSMLKTDPKAWVSTPR